MRMSRVNITIPDELLQRARAAGLNVSGLAAAALLNELDRRAKLVELEAYLRQLDTELGPVPEDERRAAQAWGDRLESAHTGAERPDARPA
jgi:hypothetical protein